jgi:hypothetical protein
VKVKARDFTVFKASADLELESDRILMVATIKNGGVSLEAAKAQLGECLQRLVDKYTFSDGEPLYGLLVVGMDVMLASLQTPGGLVE